MCVQDLLQVCMKAGFIQWVEAMVKLTCVLQDRDEPLLSFSGPYSQREC